MVGKKKKVDIADVFVDGMDYSRIRTDFLAKFRGERIDTHYVNDTLYFLQEALEQAKPDYERSKEIEQKYPDFVQKGIFGTGFGPNTRIYESTKAQLDKFCAMEKWLEEQRKNPSKTNNGNYRLMFYSE